MRTAVLASLLLLPATLGACQRESSDKDKKKGSTASTGSGPNLELFVMSQCPYGVQVVNAVADAREKLGGNVNVSVGYIGDGSGDSLQSMHGPAEVKGDIAQVCAIEQSPDKALDMMVCQNKNPRAVDTNWKDCAADAGLDAEALGSCVDGDHGKELLTAAFETAKKRGAQGSPTIFLEGKPYQGGRKPRDFMRAVCAATKGDKPEACSKIPEAPRVDAIFLSDKRCKECDIHGLEPRLKSMLGGLVAKHVDYGTAEGKTLYTQITASGGDKMLPTILFTAAVEKDTDGYPEIKKYLKPAGEYRQLMMGGKFDPAAEICDNTIDDNGDGKSDCSDATCTETLGCRPSKPRELDLFVMSHCPYGAKAMIAANEFVDHMGDDVSLNVHFIGDQAGGELRSMHGPSEVAEDIREQCAITKYGKKHQFMKYLSCRSKDYKSEEWQPCAKEAGMDEKVISACAEGDGKKLVGQSFAFADSLQIASSPTFLVNNKREFNAIAAADIQTQYCKDNPGLKGCANAIVSADPAAAGAGQPAGQCN